MVRQVSGPREVGAGQFERQAPAAGWVAVDVCTLPSAERPLRVAEFGELFARSLRRVVQVSRTRLRLELDAAAAGAARDLAGRETGCCSFFTFGFEPAGEDAVWMDVGVPLERAGVLAGLAARARAAVGVRL